MNRIVFSPNGQNRTPEVVEALRTAPDGTTLCFEPGVYDFSAEDAYRGYFSPSCNMSSDKKVIFPILSKKNITVDGGGAVFLFHDRVFPFIAQHSEAVTLQNFTVDFSFPRYIQAVTEEITDQYIKLGLLDEDVDFFTNEVGNLCVRCGQETMDTGQQRFFLEERGVHCYLVAGKCYYDTEGWSADIFFCDAVKEGSAVKLFYNSTTDYVPAFTPGKRLAISYDESRMNDVIFLDRSKDITVQNVTVHRGAGMGIVGNCCHGLTLDHFVIEPRAERNDLFSTTADGILLTNFSGKIHMRGCRLQRTMDDAMSIHGVYTVIDRIVAPDKLIVKHLHRQWTGVNVCFPGDVITFSAADTMEETGTAVVKEAYFERDLRQLVISFTEPLGSGVHIGDWLENKTRMPEVLIEGCDFGHFPALRLGSPKRTVFRNNTLHDGKLIINDLLGYWCASGCVHDLCIADNRFERSTVEVLQTRDSRTDAMHTNITVADNRFTDCACALRAQCTEGIRFLGNQLIRTGRPVFDGTCRDVTEEYDK